jgi:hypothetical protein
MTEEDKNDRLKLMQKLYERRASAMPVKMTHGTCGVCGDEGKNLRRINDVRACATCEHLARGAKTKPDVLINLVKKYHPEKIGAAAGNESGGQRRGDYIAWKLVKRIMGGEVTGLTWEDIEEIRNI